MKTNNYKALLWIIAILVILNLGLIGFFFISSPPNGNPQKASEFLIQELQFDAQQREEYKELMKSHRQKADSVLLLIRNSKKDYFEKIGSQENAEAALEQLTNHQAELERITFKHFQSVYELGNEQQKQKFKEVIHQAMQKMAKGAPAHRENDGRRHNRP